MPERLDAFPGVLELVEPVKRLGFARLLPPVPTAKKVRVNLQKIGLPTESWNAVVTGELVEHKKTEPDIFLLAAKTLGNESTECVVVEDTANGIQAAKATGMRSVGIAHTLPAKDFKAADLVKEKIEHMTISDLAPILNSR